MLPLAWLPNQAGFRFLGVRLDWSRVECVVERGPDGLHRVKGVAITELRGWVRL